MGFIPWARISSLDHANNDDGEPLQIQLMTSDYHVLTVSAPAGENGEDVCTVLLDRIVSLWDGSKQPGLTVDDGAIYRFVPFRLWVYLTPIWFSYVLGAAVAVALIPAAGSFLRALIAVPLVVVLVTWIVGGGCASSWNFAAPRRARAFRIVGDEMKSADGQFSIDLRRSKMVPRRREGPFYDIEYVEAQLVDGRRIDLMPFGTDLREFVSEVGSRLQS